MEQNAVCETCEVGYEDDSTYQSCDSGSCTLSGACPDCGGMMAHEGGCTVCYTCGHSACG